MDVFSRYLFAYQVTDASAGCEPSRMFHRRIPYNILDQKIEIQGILQPKGQSGAFEAN